MAPLPFTILSTRHVDPSTISDLSISSLELDRRSSPHDLPSYLSDLTLSQREALTSPTTTTPISKRSSLPSTLSPHEAGALLRARNPVPDATTNKFTHGAGTISPDSINNKGVLALFGLLSASLVFASIWFFFWAKNGGFVWRKGDWEDYKSTVLRRKGPDGKTLSNATASTELGGGSVVGSMGVYDAESVVYEHGAKNGNGKGKKVKGKGKKGRAARDEDVRAYRHEKPAKVGGLNRQPDATYTDYTNTNTNTDPSEFSHPFTPPRRETVKDKRNPRVPSHTPGSEASFSVLSDDRRPLRSSPHHHRHSNHSSPTHTPTKNRSRQSSPRKRDHIRPAAHRPASERYTNTNTYTDPIDFESRYTASEAETGDSGSGTKSYFHPIPGLSVGRGVGVGVGVGVGGAVGKKNGAGGAAAAGGGGGGFRRSAQGMGGRARRDSLSDSEGETGTYRATGTEWEGSVRS